MKKLITVITLLLILLLTACTGQAAAPNGTDKADSSQPGGITILDEGVWPENEYTEGLPVPTGTVAWAMLDTEHGNCSISIERIEESDYNDYMALLTQQGFSAIKSVSENIKGQDYVSIGTVLSDNERWLSISYIPGNLGIYISFAE